MTSANEPLWLTLDIVIAAHDATIARQGGLPGIRDAGALESALARPQNKWSYGETDIVALAAAYGFGLARNHAFSDGNKRIALIVCLAFLKKNGLVLQAQQKERAATFLALASGDLSEDALADWLRSRAVPA